MSRIRLHALIGIVLVVSCGSEPAEERVGRHGSTLLVPGTTPVPCRSIAAMNANKWAPPSEPDDAFLILDGTAVDVLAADALTQCAAGQRGSNGQIRGSLVAHDAYLQWLQTEMLDGLLGAPPIQSNTKDDRSAEQRWADIRARPEYNCDPTTKNNLRKVTLRLDAGVTESIPNQYYSAVEKFSSVAVAANSDLRTAGMNLCIAQHLRRASPGASSGEALLLDEANQRWLLEVIRGRAQIAMLHYALLGSVFSLTQNTAAPHPSIHSSRTIPVLSWWAAECAKASPTVCKLGHLTDMGRDFAAAVQLHVMVTEEMAQLLARSGSARVKRGGSPATRPDDVWGPGAWKQRMMALLFGGDPLAIEVDGPWQHPLGSHTASVYYAASWPDVAQMPYFRTEVAEPQVRELMSLAQRHDRLRLERDTTACFDYKLEESAELIYNSVEARIRLETCAVLIPGTGTCETDLNKLTPTSATPLSEMVLWQQHRITRTHASTLVHHLAELLSFGGVPYYCEGPTGEPKDSRLGALNVAGEIQSLGLPVYIPSGTTFVEPPLSDSAPKYTRFASLRIPDPEEVVPLADSGKQGFHGCGSGACPNGVSQSTEAKRLMGSASALAAVRRSILGSLSYLNAATPGTAPTGRVTTYFGQSDRILALIAGAIGDESFSLRPVVSATPTSPPDVVFPAIPVTVNGVNQYRSLWAVEGTIEEGDAFWEPGVENYVCAIEDPHAGNLAAEPGSKIFGKTIESLANQAFANYHCWTASRVAPAIDAKHGGPPRWKGHVATNGPLQDFSPRTVWPTLVAVRVNPWQYRLLGSQFKATAHTSNVLQGQYVATGGALGKFAGDQSEHLETNPVESRYDAFGYRTDWVPPLDATLAGGQPGQSSASLFLDLARSSSNEATAAVEKAIDQLIEMEQNEVAEAAAAANSKAGIQEEKQALCGASEKCVVAVIMRKPSSTWYKSAPSKPLGYPNLCPINPKTQDEVSKAIDCLVYQVFDALLTMDVPIAKPVEDQIQAPAAPSFAEYSGGSLQPAFIKQWGALHAPDEKLKSLVASGKAVKAQMAVAEAALQAVSNQKKEACGTAGAVKGFLSGLSVGIGKGAGISWSPGGIIAQMDKCSALKDQLKVEQKKVIAAQQEAIAAMAAAVQGAVDAQVAIQLSGAEIEGLVNQAKLRTARYELEADLASQTAKTSFGLARRYRAYDLWRAKALVENARRYALAARRSIEARNVVNLSTLTKSEAFVQSPATWADEVYAYDLSLPASVGLSTGESETGAIYSNKVKDYVGNLEAFVSGYAVTRPAAVAMEDIDVITLPGMSSDTPFLINPETGDPCVSGDSVCVTRYADRGNWLVRCVSSGQWKELNPALPASEACGKDCALCGCGPVCDQQCLDFCDSTALDTVDRARFEFTLDPWGRLNRSVSTEPYQKRFNGRWGQLAVNVVGTGVKDCKLAGDPLGCYSETFIPYNLVHVGPAWVTDYDEIWRLQAVPFGRIEGGKAIAAELWLDPLKDGWSTSYVGAVKRTELKFRPLGGAYELEIAVGPEVQLDRIERIQLLVGSEYWVKQQ